MTERDGRSMLISDDHYCRDHRVCPSCGWSDRTPMVRRYLIAKKKAHRSCRLSDELREVGMLRCRFLLQSCTFQEAVQDLPDGDDNSFVYGTLITLLIGVIFHGLALLLMWVSSIAKCSIVPPPLFYIPAVLFTLGSISFVISGLLFPAQYDDVTGGEYGVPAFFDLEAGLYVYVIGTILAIITAGLSFALECVAG